MTAIWILLGFVMFCFAIAIVVVVVEECREQWRTYNRMRRWQDGEAFTTGLSHDTGNLRILEREDGDAEDGQIREDG